MLSLSIGLRLFDILFDYSFLCGELAKVRAKE